MVSSVSFSPTRLWLLASSSASKKVRRSMMYCLGADGTGQAAKQTEQGRQRREGSGSRGGRPAQAFTERREVQLGATAGI